MIIQIEEACRLACELIGVDYKPVGADGRFHLADLTDDHRGKNDARIKIFQDRQGGIVWNHKSGDRHAFFVDDNREQRTPIAPEERERIAREQQQRQAELLQRQNKAAQRAKAIWQQAQTAPVNHPYLTRKQVKPHGLRIGKWQRVIQQANRKHTMLVIDNALLVPMFDATGSLRSLQGIFLEQHSDLERDKDFFPGGGLTGLFWRLGAKTEKILIAEGFATAASLHEETGHRVYMAFTANNLLAVGRLLREKLPNAELVFCADNDTKTPGNPGLSKATEAAQAVGGSIAVPPIHGDFNDYAALLKEQSNG